MTQVWIRYPGKKVMKSNESGTPNLNRSICGRGAHVDPSTRLGIEQQSVNRKGWFWSATQTEKVRGGNSQSQFAQWNPG